MVSVPDQVVSITHQEVSVPDQVVSIIHQEVSVPDEVVPIIYNDGRLSELISCYYQGKGFVVGNFLFKCLIFSSVVLFIGILSFTQATPVFFLC